MDQKEVHCQDHQCAVCVRVLEVPVYLSVFLLWGSEEGRVRLLGVPFWRFSILEDRHRLIGLCSLCVFLPSCT